MSHEGSARIAAFRRVSGYLLWVSMPMLILICLTGAILFLILMLGPIGNQTLLTLTLAVLSHSDGVGSLFKLGFTMPTKVILLIATALGFSMMAYMLFHFQKLVECFFEGRIFNRTALAHARNAYRMNVALFVLFATGYLLMVLFVFLFTSQGTAAMVGAWLADSLGSLVELGFMSLMLWAMDIGTELNEDAELTI